MRLRDLLPQEHIRVPLEAASLRDATAALVRALADAGDVRDIDALAGAVTDARLRGTIAVGELVALPHFRTDAVDRLLVALGVAAEPLAADEAGLEISPRIVVLIVAPPGAATLYLQTVSALARLLRDRAVAGRILEARSPDDVLRISALDRTDIEPELAVRDVMAHRVHRLSPESTVRDAVDLMVRRGLRAVPVVGGKDEVLGMVTDRDVMKALLPQVPRAGGDEKGGAPESARAARVRDIMSRSVLCVAEDTALDEVASIMINKDVEQLPVVSEGKLTGFVTRADIIRKLFAR